MQINPYYHLPLSVRHNITSICNPEEFDLPDSIKNNLPDFSRFLYAYLDWLQVNKPPLRNDIDTLPEEFVAQLKYQLAVSFPDQNKILDSLEVLPEGVSDVDQFYGNNILSSFLLSYDVNSEIVLGFNVVIKDLYNGIIELTEDVDYVIRDKVIYLINSGDIFSIKPLTTNQNLIVTYNLKSESKITTYSNRNPINYKKFLKKIKDFYKSKGSEASFNFIFNLLYNENIRISYPKEKIFRLSSNAYESEKRIYITKNSLYPDSAVIKEIKFLTTTNSVPVDSCYEIGDVNGTIVQTISTDNLDFSTSPNVGERVVLRDQNGYTYVEKVLPIVTNIKVKSGGNYYEVGNQIVIRYKDAFATAMVNNIQSGSIDDITVINGGMNYRKGEVILFSNPQSNYGTPARAIVTEVDDNGSVVSIRIVNPGSGYKSKPEYSSEKYYQKSYYDSMDIQSIKYSLITMNYLKRYYSIDILPEKLVVEYYKLLISTFTNYVDFNNVSIYNDDEFLEYNDVYRAINSSLMMYSLDIIDTNETILSTFNQSMRNINWGLLSVYDYVFDQTNSEDLSNFIEHKANYLLSQTYSQEFKKNINVDFDWDRYNSILLGVRNQVEFYTYEFIFDKNIDMTFDLDTILDEVFSQHLLVKRYSLIKETIDNILDSIILSDLTKLQNIKNEAIRILNNNINYIISDYDNRISLFNTQIINYMKNHIDPIHKARYYSLLNAIQTDNALLNDIEIDDVGYINEAQSVKNIGSGLVIDIHSSIGKIKNLVLTNPGGFIENDIANIDIVDYNGSAEFEVEFGTLYTSPAVLSEKGAILSSDNCYLSDNYYFQEYSYVVHSTKIIDEWSPYIKKLCHPAGMKFFGSMNIPTLHIKLGIADHEIKYIINVINDLTNYKGSGESLEPVIADNTTFIDILPPQHLISSSYYSFDRYKFEIDNENANKYVNKFFWDRDDLVPKDKTRWILADTPADSHNFLSLSVSEIEAKKYKYFHPRPDSFINVYPKTYFIRREEKYLPGTFALGSTYRSFEVNKVFSETNENESYDFIRDRNDPNLFNIQDGVIDKDTMSLDVLEKYSRVKANFAISARVFIRKNN